MQVLLLGVDAAFSGPAGGKQNDWGWADCTQKDWSDAPYKRGYGLPAWSFVWRVSTDQGGSGD